jgi:hypothetical protein
MTGETGTARPITQRARDQSAGMARRSWLRELIPSLAKTLPRWYWTVRALMNSSSRRARSANASIPSPLPDGGEIPVRSAAIRIVRHICRDYGADRCGHGGGAATRHRMRLLASRCYRCLLRLAGRADEPVWSAQSHHYQEVEEEPRESAAEGPELQRLA